MHEVIDKNGRVSPHMCPSIPFAAAVKGRPAFVLLFTTMLFRTYSSKQVPDFRLQHSGVLL